MYKNIYRHTEKGFEKLVSIAITLLGNSITFIIALCTVIFWFGNKQFYMQDIHNCVGDVILGSCLFEFIYNTKIVQPVFCITASEGE